MAAPQPKLNQLRRYPIAAICGGITIVVVAVFALRFGLLDEAKQQLAQQQSEADALHRNIRNGTELPDQLTALQNGLARLEQRLMKSGDVAAYQQFFFKLETDSGVKIVRFQPANTARSSQVKQPGSYQPLGFDLTVEGGFPDLVRFAHNLEASSRHFRMVSFSVRRGAAAGPVQSNLVTLVMGLELLGSQ